MGCAAGGCGLRGCGLCGRGLLGHGVRIGLVFLCWCGLFGKIVHVAPLFVLVQVSCAVAVYGVRRWHRYSIAGPPLLRVWEEYQLDRASAPAFFCSSSSSYAGAFLLRARTENSGSALARTIFYDIPHERGSCFVGTRCGFSRSPQNSW